MEDIQKIVLQNLQKVRSAKTQRYQSVIFEDIRESFIRNQFGEKYEFLEIEENHEQLKDGRKSLENIEECMQYWYSYCKNFIPKPWAKLAYLYGNLCMYKQLVEIYDYASGQGQATILLLDHFYKNREKDKIKTINLIEKSSFALTVAKDIFKFHSPEIATSKINLINQDINQFDLSKYIFDKNSYKIHLFSYILDMGVIDAKNLVTKILSITGKHFIWAVSQNSGKPVNKNSKTGKLHFEEFYDELMEQIKINSNIHLKHGGYQIDLQENQFTNSRAIQKPFIFFGTYFEVK